MALSKEAHHGMSFLSSLDTWIRREPAAAVAAPETVAIPAPQLSEQLRADLEVIADPQAQRKDDVEISLLVKFEINGRGYDAHVVDGDSVVPSDIKWKEEVKRGDEIITVTHSLELGAGTLPLHTVTDPHRKEPVGEALVHGWLNLTGEPDPRDHTTGPVPLDYGVLKRVASDVHLYRDQLIQAPA